MKVDDERLIQAYKRAPGNVQRAITQLLQEYGCLPPNEAQETDSKIIPITQAQKGHRKMKTFTINGKDVSFQDCSFTFEGTTIYGVYAHQLDDMNSDGDFVIGNVSMPENAEDAELMLFNEAGISDSDILDTVQLTQKPRQISVDNGIHFITPAEAIDQQPWEIIAQYMDEQTRKQVHDELAPCTELQFLERYLELAPCDLIIG